MSDKETQQARKLWELGLDTFDIADVLDTTEARVCAAICPQGLGEEGARLGAACAAHG